MLNPIFKKFVIFFLLAMFADQIVKSQILGGFRWESSCISITYVLNDGVAFSMLAFLQDYLKYVQFAFIGAMAYYLFRERYFLKFPIELGVVFGSGMSNLNDRFVHGGVVDYVYWHCGFNFAIFNLADVMIDLGIGLLLLKTYIEHRLNSTKKPNTN
jgi:signal peptidase II